MIRQYMSTRTDIVVIARLDNGMGKVMKLLWIDA